MRVILVMGAILFAAGLLLAWKFSPAGRAKAAGIPMVTPRALLFYLGVVAAVVGALFLLLAAAATLG